MLLTIRPQVLFIFTNSSNTLENKQNQSATRDLNDHFQGKKSKTKEGFKTKEGSSASHPVEPTPATQDHRKTC